MARSVMQILENEYENPKSTALKQTLNKMFVEPAQTLAQKASGAGQALLAANNKLGTGILDTAKSVVKETPGVVKTISGDKSLDPANPNAAATRDTVMTAWNSLKGSSNKQPDNSLPTPKTTEPTQEPGLLKKAGDYLSGVGKQAGEFYNQHSGKVNLGLGAAALGGLGYAAYKKLKKDRVEKKEKARMLA